MWPESAESNLDARNETGLWNSHMTTSPEFLSYSGLSSLPKSSRKKNIFEKRIGCVARV
jgi:hypothetical protein